MQFNSFSFLVFFPVTVFIYFVIPPKTRYLWLLGASYYFYMCWNAKYALLLAFSTLATYFGALAVARLRAEEKHKAAKAAMFFVIAANLALLAYFKYANFIVGSVNAVLETLSMGARLNVIDVVLPVGISFFIFQAMAYLIDVYRGQLEAEKNVLRYALFVSFFPQLVAGPIERAVNLLPQIRNIENIRLWDFKRIQRGLLTMLYGFVIKMVIADWIATPVNVVFTNYMDFPPGAYLLVMVLFGIQIYCDFSGYSSIAIGAAQVMGIGLMENFRAPFFARSIREFWSRWHISLSTWFMDYLYIPLGGSRRGKLRKLINLSLVFAVSGLWHGAAWHFVLWGIMHAVFRVIEELLFPIRRKLMDKLQIGEDNVFLHIFEIAVSFALVTFTWPMFRAESVSQALYMIGSVFRAEGLLSGLLALRPEDFWLRTETVYMLAAALVFLFTADMFKEKKISFSDWFEKRNGFFRAAFFLAGALAIFIFGAYGEGYDAASFIYFQF